MRKTAHEIVVNHLENPYNPSRYIIIKKQDYDHMKKWAKFGIKSLFDGIGFNSEKQLLKLQKSQFGFINKPNSNNSLTKIYEDYKRNPKNRLKK